MFGVLGVYNFGQSIKMFVKKRNKMYVCLFVCLFVLAPSKTSFLCGDLYIRYLVNLTILNGVDLESSFCLNIGGSFEQQQSLLVHRSSHR